MCVSYFHLLLWLSSTSWSSIGLFFACFVECFILKFILWGRIVQCIFFCRRMCMWKLDETFVFGNAFVVIQSILFQTLQLFSLVLDRNSIFSVSQLSDLDSLGNFGQILKGFSNWKNLCAKLRFFWLDSIDCFILFFFFVRMFLILNVCRF